MKFDLLDNGARVTGLTDIEAIKDELRKEGQLLADGSIFRAKTPLGSVEAALEWGPSSVVMRVIKSPPFVRPETVYRRVRELVENRAKNQ